MKLSDTSFSFIEKQTKYCEVYKNGEGRKEGKKKGRDFSFHIIFQELKLENQWCRVVMKSRGIMPNSGVPVKRRVEDN